LDLQIGAATGQMLKAQTEQIQRIDKQVDEVESNIVLAEKQLRAFMRCRLPTEIRHAHTDGSLTLFAALSACCANLAGWPRTR